MKKIICITMMYLSFLEQGLHENVNLELIFEIKELDNSRYCNSTIISKTSESFKFSLEMGSNLPYFWLNQGYIGRSTLVGQHPMKSLLCCLSTVCARRSVRCPSLSFLKIEILVFFWYCMYIIIADHDIQWLTTDRAIFLKKLGGPNLGQIQMSQKNWAQN